MANTITARIYEICPTNERQSRDGSKTFYDRDIRIDCTSVDQFTGERGRDNYPTLNFGGDKCQLLDQFQVGQVVTISFALNGMKYEKNGETKFFTKVQAYEIEAYQSRMAQPQQNSDLAPLSAIPTQSARQYNAPMPAAQLPFPTAQEAPTMTDKLPWE